MLWIAVTSTGFVRWKSKPASLDWRLSSSLPQPVMATTTAPASAGSASESLRHLVTVHPGETDVEQHHVGLEQASCVQGLRAVMSGPGLVSADLEDPRQARGAVDVVIDHQHSTARFGGGRRDGLGGRWRLACPALILDERKSHAEGTSFSEPRAQGGDRAAVQVDQSLDQGQANAQPALRRSSVRFTWVNISKTSSSIWGECQALCPSRGLSLHGPALRPRSSIHPPSGVYLAALVRRLLITWASRSDRRRARGVLRARRA